MVKKVLIGILACHKRANYCEAQRQTWLPKLKADYKFFFGRHPEGKLPDKNKYDEVWLDVLDDYDHLTDKSWAMFAWALNHEYDYLFKCDDDTYVDAYRLTEEADFGRADYIGMKIVNPRGSYASGGAGYWLSQKAMQILIQHSVPSHSAEDAYVGEVLEKAGIELQHDHRYLDRQITQNPISESEFPCEQMHERHGVWLFQQRRAETSTR